MKWYVRKGEETVLNIPYGEDILRVPFCLQKEPQLLLPGDARSVGIRDALLEGLEHPLDTPPLREIIGDQREVAIVVDDDTRPRYAAAILPTFLGFLKENGIRRANVIIAVGLHRPLDEERRRATLGDLPAWVEVENHDAYHSLSPLGDIGGRSVLLNHHFVSAPFKVIIGDVELHQIFGYGGGAKSLVPGLSDPETITWLHSFLLSVATDFSVA